MDKEKIPFDVSFIPDFERRLAYWREDGAQQEQPSSLDDDMSIIFSEEIESIGRYIENLGCEEMDASNFYKLLTHLRSFVEAHVPGGLEEFNQHYWREVEAAKAEKERHKAFREARKAKAEAEAGF